MENKHCAFRQGHGMACYDICIKNGKVVSSMSGYSGICDNCPHNKQEVSHHNMSDSGMCRRMDDLGRLVVPKQVREKLNINSNDLPPFEIYTEIKDGKKRVIFELIEGED